MRSVPWRCQAGWEELQGCSILCFGLGVGRRRQEFLKDLACAGVSLVALRFPGETWIEPSDVVTLDVIPERLQADILRYGLTSREFDCALTFEEFHVTRLAETGRQLVLRETPLPASVAVVCRDKVAMKRVLGDSALPLAAWDTWSTIGELSHCLSKMGVREGGYVLKPRLGTGSAGVYRAHSQESVETAAREFLRSCVSSATGQPEYETLSEPPFIVEEYLGSHGTGIEVAVEGFVSSGRARVAIISEKESVRHYAPFTENNYVSPPETRRVIEDVPRIERLTQDVLRAVGVRDSVFHLEIRYDGEDIFVLEVASRPSGGLVSEACHGRTGINLRLAHARLSLGLPVVADEPQCTATYLGSVYATRPCSDRDLQQVREILSRHEPLACEFGPRPEERRYVIHDCLVACCFGANSGQEARARYECAFEEIQEVLQ